MATDKSLARRLLDQVTVSQWQRTGEGDNDFCPECSRTSQEGHSHTCPVKQLIDEAEKTLNPKFPVSSPASVRDAKRRQERAESDANVASLRRTGGRMS